MPKPKKPIRVILLDAKTKTVAEHTIEPTLSEFYRLLGCKMIEAFYPTGMSRHVCYCDEEGLYNGHETGVLVQGFQHTLIHGSVIILGTDNEGNDRDCLLNLESVERNTRFLPIIYE